MSANSEEARKLKAMGQWATRVLLAIGAVLVVLEFIVHRHGEIALEDLPLFPAGLCFFRLYLHRGWRHLAEEDRHAAGGLLR